MSLHVRSTDDGSFTLFSEVYQECYHSSAGAVSESIHVFIDSGLNAIKKQNIKVFEVGFGTGLNALLSCLEGQKNNLFIDYSAIELYPVGQEILNELEATITLFSKRSVFHSLHDSAWNQRVELSPNFHLTKLHADLLTTKLDGGYDLIYFDAFSPAVQPELWTEEVFEKIYSAMTDGGLLTTYCAKGAVRRALQKAGFTVERLPGRPPKREMLRARK